VNAAAAAAVVPKKLRLDRFFFFGSFLLIFSLPIIIDFWIPELKIRESKYTKFPPSLLMNLLSTAYNYEFLTYRSRV
jgi:hypothetical protein